MHDDDTSQYERGGHVDCPPDVHPKLDETHLLEGVLAALPLCHQYCEIVHPLPVGRFDTTIGIICDPEKLCGDLWGRQAHGTKSYVMLLSELLEGLIGA